MCDVVLQGLVDQHNMVISSMGPVVVNNLQNIQTTQTAPSTDSGETFIKLYLVIEVYAA